MRHNDELGHPGHDLQFMAMFCRNIMADQWMYVSELSQTDVVSEEKVPFCHVPGPHKSLQRF